MANNNLWAVMTTFSFDSSAQCRLFPTYEKALKFLKQEAIKEFKTDVEENGYDGVLSIKEDEGYASITLYLYSEIDIIEWHIAEVIRPEGEEECKK